jgi:hypothetical protein
LKRLAAGDLEKQKAEADGGTQNPKLGVLFSWGTLRFSATLRFLKWKMRNEK